MKFNAAIMLLFITATIAVPAEPLAIMGIAVPQTGVYQGYCWGHEGWEQATKDCCADIGGDKRKWFDETQKSCKSIGGVATRRVWKEELERCCNARKPLAYMTTTCNWDIVRCHY